MTIVYIGAGANDNPLENLRGGIQLLQKSVEIEALSAIYETAPVETHSRKPYLNMALKIQTNLKPEALKTLMRQIEDTRGRIRIDENGQKSQVIALDFDILLYGNVVNEKLPHSDILKHAYAVVPLADIAPDVQHPVSGQSIAEIAAQFADTIGLKRRDDMSIV